MKPLARQVVLRFFVLATLLVVLFAPSVNRVQAQNPPPPTPPKITRERISLEGVSIAEVLRHYERLGGRKGPFKVVVEFTQEPAALVYAGSAGAPQMQVATLTANRVQSIRQQQDSFMQAVRERKIQVVELFRTQRVYNGIWLRVESVQDLQKLRALPGVKAIHPVIPKEVEHTTSVPLIGALEAWGGLPNVQGEGVKIGIIDTGVDYIHTNFGGPGSGYATQDFTRLTEPGNLFPTAKVVGGYDFVGDAYNASDPFSIPQPDPDPMDCNGHGSHVAGTAAGFGVLANGSTYQESLGDTYADLKDLSPQDYRNKFRIGPGVAPKALIYALRVFGCSGSTDVTEQAIEWAMDPNGDGDFSDHLDVINLSLGAPFGSEYDTSAIAANNAALAGVLVAASAGNNGDVFYITGAPAVARYAVSVAASNDQGARVSAFEVTQPSGIAGLHPAVEADFGPDPGTPGVTGELVYADPANGCSTITNDVNGKIALIDRGGCFFVDKVKNAQNAGAIGVLVANNVGGFPFAMGGSDPTITIPSMLTTKDVGDTLKANLPGVFVRLTSQYRDQYFLIDPAEEDRIPTFTSRGPARFDTRLKPDLTAPGETIYSTAALSGNQGVSYNGTSMAAPHVAGALALLRQLHPTWTVAEIKAALMNTATDDLWTGLNKTGTPYTPTRIGAGRIHVARAAASSVIAYNKEDPGQVSVSFGEVPVVDSVSGVDLTLFKSILVENKSGTPLNYNVSFLSRYQVNPGLTFTLLEADDDPITNPITVPAGGTFEVKVRVDLDAGALNRARDGTISTVGGRNYFSEGGGYVEFTSTGSEPTLRVPVYIAPRPASQMEVLESEIDLPANQVGTFDLTPSGSEVWTSGNLSWVYIHSLLSESPDEPWSAGPNQAADLHYIGASTDYPYWGWDDSAVYFGIATYGKWDTPNAVEFDIFVDVDEDYVEDYVIFNASNGFFGSGSDDILLAVFCPLDNIPDGCDAWYYLNGVSGGINTVAFHNNVMTLLVPPAGIGLEEGKNTDFNFYVVSWSRDDAWWVDISDWMSFDVGRSPFYTVDENYTEMPLWYDLTWLYPTFTIGYDKEAIGAMDIRGLLLLHHFNTPTESAEVVPLGDHIALFRPDYKRTLWGSFLVPIQTAIVLANRANTSCAFNLAVVGNTWPASLSRTSLFVPAHQSQSVQLTVQVPFLATLGDSDAFNVTATCLSDPTLAATLNVETFAQGSFFLPLIRRR